MLVSTTGGGNTMNLPDVVPTVVGPSVAPIVYVDLGFCAMAVVFVPNVLNCAMPTLNMGMVIPVTFGDQAGMPGLTMRPATLASSLAPHVLVGGLPVASLCAPSIGNGGNAPLGMVASPSPGKWFVVFAAVEGRLPSSRVSRVDAATMAARLSGMAPPVSGATLVGDVGHLRLHRFCRRAPAAMRRALSRLRRAGMRRLIVDLRDNRGGFFGSFAAVAADLLPQGAGIGEVVDGVGRQLPHAWRGCGAFADIPLTLLVNRNTASAAELFAATMRAHGRARIVGERTYGKGRGQRIRPDTIGADAYAAQVVDFICADGSTVGHGGIEPDLALEHDFHNALPGVSHV